MSEVLRCDFCSDQNPKYWYPAKDFQAWQVDEVSGNSKGEWAACEPCHAMIEANPPDKAGLVLRSLVTLIAGGGKPTIAQKMSYSRQIAVIQQKFFENREGPAVPIIQEENT